MEEEVKNKKNKTVLIISIIVVLILLIVGGYFVLSKNDNKKEDKPTTENKDSNSNSNENNEEQGEALDLNSELIQALYNNLGTVMGIDYYFYENSSVTIDKLPIDKKYAYALQRLNAKDIKMVRNPEYDYEDESLDDGEEHYMFEISEEKMEEALKKALGEKAELEKRSLTYDDGYNIYTFVRQETGEEYYSNVAIEYNADKKSFKVELNTGGGWGYSGEVTKIKKAIKNDKIITITEKAIFINDHPDKENPTEYFIYSDLNHTKDIGKISVKEYDAMLHGNSDKGFDDLISDYDNKAMTVVYTFEENEDGSYHFVSSKMTN